MNNNDDYQFDNDSTIAEESQEVIRFLVLDHTDLGGLSVEWVIQLFCQIGWSSFLIL